MRGTFLPYPVYFINIFAIVDKIFSCFCLSFYMLDVSSNQSSYYCRKILYAVTFPCHYFKYSNYFRELQVIFTTGKFCHFHSLQTARYYVKLVINVISNVYCVRRSSMTIFKCNANA